MSFSKQQVSFSSNFASSFSVIKKTPLYFFRPNNKYFAREEQMRVHVLETSSAWVRFHQILAICETTDQIFFQIFHQSSGSWDITPLYFLAKILYNLRSQSKYKFGEILREKSREKYVILHFDWLLLSKTCTVSAKKVQKFYLSWHWTMIQSFKKNSLIVWKMTWEI